MNNVTLIGRFTADPNLHFAAGSELAICRFTLAIPRLFKREETDFINCVAFGKNAENITQYLLKGRKLLLVDTYKLEAMKLKTALKDILLM